MKQLLLAIAIVGAVALPALSGSGGISGHVIDAKSGKALAGVPLEIYRMPVQHGDAAVARLHTDKSGFFVDADLPTGRYLVAALADGKAFGCNVDDVFDSAMTRFTLGVGDDKVLCSGPRVSPGLVNADITADLTVIR
jgi:hypothetical protein